MKRAVKGNYGYLDAKRIQVLIRTIVFFVIPLLLFATGYITTGTRKNLLTVVAVLGCLPACKSLVSLIMYFRSTGCSLTAKETIEKQEGHLIGMYDMYFTSYKQNFPVSHMVVEGKNVCGYTEISSCDTKACETHLETMLKQGGYKDLTIKIFTDITKYVQRLKQLNELTHERTPERDDEVRVVLYDISL